MALTHALTQHSRGILTEITVDFHCHLLSNSHINIAATHYNVATAV